MNGLVCLSVCSSVTPFWQCSCPCIIMKFSGVITSDTRKVHAKGQRSKVKVTEVMTPLGRFRTVTPVWIHRWLRNFAQSLNKQRRGALLFSSSSVKFQGHTGKKRKLWPKLMIHKAWSSIGEVPFVFQSHPSNFKVTRDKKCQNRALPDCNPSLNSRMAMKCCKKFEVA